MKTTIITALFSAIVYFSVPISAQLPRFELVDYPDGPVIIPGFQGNMDNQAVLDPDVIWDGNRVRIYYTAVDALGVKRIMLATSSDLVNWRPEGIALAPQPGTFDSDGVSAPDIIYIDGQYHLYYTAESMGLKQIAHVQSENGFSFSRLRTITLTPSYNEQQFDSIGVSDSSTIYSNGLYQMLFRGHDGTPWWKIGLAISTSGTHFDRIIGGVELGSNFGKGPHGFDDGGAEDPEIWIDDENHIRMLYTSLHY